MRSGATVAPARRRCAGRPAARPAWNHEHEVHVVRESIHRGAVGFCVALGKAFGTGRLSRFGLRARASGGRFEAWDRYRADRVTQVDAYRDLFRPFGGFEGLTVLELGCHEGYLLDAWQRHERFRAIGADINRQALARGRAAYGSAITFIQSTPTAVPLPEESVDRIYTVDTVEHLSRPREIFQDCFRVLRPGGRFLIHFHPWLAPYGSHLEDILPVPWLHVLFPMDTLVDAAARLYDLEDYKPACYWLDPVTGARRPNPYRDRAFWREYLNGMTIRRFRALLDTLPFRTVHVRRIGFGGKAYRLARYLRGLAQAPGLDEFFTQALFCVLEKPAATRSVGETEGTPWTRR